MNGQTVNSLYKYRSHLFALDSCTPLGIELSGNQSSGCQWDMITTPLVLSEWERQLSSHPDKGFVDYIIKGIEQGFRLGYDRGLPRCISAEGNMPVDHPEVVSEYLERETVLRRVIKLPTGAAPAPFQVSPIGIIPKKHKPNKWRLIVDLSSPKDRSVNDGIAIEWSTLGYATIDHLALLIHKLGRGTLMVKADIKEAYRMVPVHPHDRWLLGMKWEGRLYMDTVLPFGLRSAPKIFSAVADAAQWILVKAGVNYMLHYLDDFIFVADSQEIAEQQKQRLVALCSQLGIPLEPTKLEGPSTRLVFLGIEVDTNTMQLRLPKDKLERLKSSLDQALGKKTLTKHNFQSLVGLLQHASKVVKPGRAFMRRLHALQAVCGTSHAQNKFVRLNTAARADLLWWHIFISQWNGVSILWNRDWLTPDIVVTSDASGAWGCGAYWAHHWFVMQWAPDLMKEPIQTKELVPVVAAAAVYGRLWAGKIVEFRSDNMPVVNIVEDTYSKEPRLMHLTRLLTFFACYHQFWFVASHIPGAKNTLADAISRNNLDLFLSQVPQAGQTPTPIPPSLMELLMLDASWTSTSWMKLFIHTIRQL